MKIRVTLAAAALTALVAAGCGSSNSSSSSSAGSTSAAAAATSSSGGSSGGGSKCTASIGIEAPLTGQVAVLGQEQLAFAQLAVAADNSANGTNITIVQGDTQL
jgi:ABC-type branched-subunit amino acid transport system substrate-binding protein